MRNWWPHIASVRHRLAGSRAGASRPALAAGQSGGASAMSAYEELL